MAQGHWSFSLPHCPNGLWLNIPCAYLLVNTDIASTLVTKLRSASVMGLPPSRSNTFSSNADAIQQGRLTCPTSPFNPRFGSSSGNLSWIILVLLHSVTIQTLQQLLIVPVVLDIGLRMSPCPLNAQRSKYGLELVSRPPKVGHHQGALSVEAVLSTVLSCIAHSPTWMCMLTCLCITDNPDPERGLFLSKDARGGSFSSMLRHFRFT